MEITPLKNKKQNSQMNLQKSLKEKQGKKEFLFCVEGKKNERRLGRGAWSTRTETVTAFNVFFFLYFFTAFYPTWEKLSAGTGKQDGGTRVSLVFGLGQLPRGPATW
jgi:hypothetical protein